MPEERKIQPRERWECPLSFGGQPEFVSWCVEERCAWWDSEVGACAVFLLADEMRRIRNLLEYIARRCEG
jgi:hypothetical protein